MILAYIHVRTIIYNLDSVTWNRRREQRWRFLGPFDSHGIHGSSCLSSQNGSPVAQKMKNNIIIDYIPLCLRKSIRICTKNTLGLAPIVSQIARPDTASRKLVPALSLISESDRLENPYLIHLPLTTKSKSDKVTPLWASYFLFLIFLTRGCL